MGRVALNKSYPIIAATRLNGFPAGISFCDIACEWELISMPLISPVHHGYPQSKHAQSDYRNEIMANHRYRGQYCPADSNDAESYQRLDGMKSYESIIRFDDKKDYSRYP